MDRGNERWPFIKKTGELLLLLMSILSQTLLAFVSSHLMSFSLLTVWHDVLY